MSQLKSAFPPLDPVLPGWSKRLLILLAPLWSHSSTPTLSWAWFRPLLIKPNLDPSLLSNFHSISPLPFLSEVMEKIVLIQLQTHLDRLNIVDRFQSGFKPHHSTESALLKVHNDIALALDAKQPVIFALLDLSAAFDTVDHTVLLSHLEHYAGLKGPALSWFTSFLTNRTFSVTIGEFSFTVAPLHLRGPSRLDFGSATLLFVYVTTWLNYIKA